LTKPKTPVLDLATKAARQGSATARFRISADEAKRIREAEAAGGRSITRIRKIGVNSSPLPRTYLPDRKSESIAADTNGGIFAGAAFSPYAALEPPGENYGWHRRTNKDSSTVGYAENGNTK